MLEMAMLSVTVALGGATTERLPFEDAHVVRDQPTVNFDGPTLDVRHDAGLGDHKAYMGFSVGNVDRNQILDAELVLTALGGTSVPQDFWLWAIPDTTWDETTVTWADAPENDTDSGELLLAGATLVDVQTLLPGQTELVFDNTILAGFLCEQGGATDTPTLVLMRTTVLDHTQQFGSQESASPPLLRVTTVGSTSCIPCDEDVNGDGVVDFADLLVILAQWGRCPGCPPRECAADIDDDCEVGFSDLLILLAELGTPVPVCL